MSEWKPIKTAPSEELAMFMIAEHVGFGVWNYDIARNVGGQLCHAWDHEPLKPSEFKPTHWRPLPEPPESPK